LRQKKEPASRPDPVYPSEETRKGPFTNWEVLLPWFALKDAQSSELDELAEKYNLHPLHIEDCRNHNERTKAERGETYLFLILKNFDLSSENEVQFARVYLFVGADFLITICGEQNSSVEALQRAYLTNPGQSPSKFFYLIFDDIVDGYFGAVAKFDDRVDTLQDSVIDDPKPQVVQDIFKLKRSLADARRILVNTRDACIYVQRESLGLLDEDLRPFFRDLYDHIANEVMKVLTILSTIALPCIAISGIYGMNVKGLPFIESPYGMLIVSAAMISTTVILLLILRKFRWL
jgi:magnesium transporter